MGRCRQEWRHGTQEYVRHAGQPRFDVQLHYSVEVRLWHKTACFKSGLSRKTRGGIRVRPVLSGGSGELDIFHGGRWRRRRSVGGVFLEVKLQGLRQKFSCLIGRITHNSYSRSVGGIGAEPVRALLYHNRPLHGLRLACSSLG